MTAKGIIDEYFLRKKRLIKLSDELKRSAKYRGHRVKVDSIDYNKGAYNISCFDCNCEGQALSDPQPNEVKIGGPIVALNCKRTK